MQSDIFLALIGVFVAVAACCGAGLYVWNSRVSPERRRLAELAGDAGNHLRHVSRQMEAR